MLINATSDSTRELISFQILEVLKFHQGIHPGREAATEVNLGVDGIKESNSSKVSLNVFAVKFPDCRNVYNVAIQRPSHMSAADKDEEARSTLVDLVSQFK